MHLAPQDDIFEWHFVMRGAPDSEFEVCLPLSASDVAAAHASEAATSPFSAAGWPA